MKIKTILLTLLLANLSAQSSSAAEPPHLLPFQGHLARPSTTDPTRFEPVPSGRYDILFTLYAAPVGGESKVWGPERHAQVTVINGLVNALLGSVIGFEDTLASQPNFFRRPLYVGITIDADGNPNTADLELVPRQVFLPAVQALNANTLDGADWRTFFIGTDADATFTPGVTKARDADTLDGHDWSQLFSNGNPATGTISGGRLADASIPGPKIAPATITSAHLADGAVGAADLANNSVRRHHILDGEVTTADLADGAVTPAKVQPDSILTSPHYFKVGQYRQLWFSFGGQATTNLTGFVPPQARGAILKVIVNGVGSTSNSGSAIFADEDGAFSTLTHYFHNGVTSYTTWSGGTVFVPFHDSQSITIRTASNTASPDSNVRCFASLIGWF
jgi:hypothetical protein